MTLRLLVLSGIAHCNIIPLSSLVTTHIFHGIFFSKPLDNTSALLSMAPRRSNRLLEQPDNTNDRDTQDPTFNSNTAKTSTKKPEKKMTTPTRPGVEASRRLSFTYDPKIWSNIDKQYKDMLSRKGGKKLTELETFCENLGTKLCISPSSSPPSLTVEEFESTIHWKFTKGKPRHALWKYLKSNSSQDIKTHSQNAFQCANSNNIKGAIEEFCKLKGVGPATASAYLSRYKPNLFVFMDDEVIETLYDKKRAYTISIYLHINEKCKEIAEKLEWCDDIARVGRTLWTASRISAEGLPDITKTLKASIGTSSKKKRDIEKKSNFETDNGTIPLNEKRGSRRKRKKV